MKYRIVSLLGGLLIGAGLSAQFQGSGQSYQKTRVEELEKLPDDSKVEVEGYIVRRISDEDYLFRGESEISVRVEIDDDLWRGRLISPKDRLRIRGEWDKDWGRRGELEADDFEVLETDA